LSTSSSLPTAPSAAAAEPSARLLHPNLTPAPPAAETSPAPREPGLPAAPRATGLVHESKVVPPASPPVRVPGGSTTSITPRGLPVPYNPINATTTHVSPPAGETPVPLAGPDPVPSSKTSPPIPRGLPPPPSAAAAGPSVLPSSKFTPAPVADTSPAPRKPGLPAAPRATGLVHESKPEVVVPPASPPVVAATGGSTTSTTSPPTPKTPRGLPAPATDSRDYKAKNPGRSSAQRSGSINQERGLPPPSTTKQQQSPTSSPAIYSYCKYEGKVMRNRTKEEVCKAYRERKADCVWWDGNRNGWKHTPGYDGKELPESFFHKSRRLANQSLIDRFIRESERCIAS